MQEYMVTASTYELLEAKVCTDECEWDGDSKPESQQCNQSTEWYCSTAAFHPQDYIQHKEHAEYDPTHHTASLPLLLHSTTTTTTTTTTNTTTTTSRANRVERMILKSTITHSLSVTT